MSGVSSLLLAAETQARQELHIIFDFVLLFTIVCLFVLGTLREVCVS